MTCTKSKSQSSSTTANAISKPKRSKLQDQIAELENVNRELNGMSPCCLDPSTTLLLTSPTSEQTIRAHEDLTDANKQINNLQAHLTGAPQADKLIPCPLGTPGDLKRGFKLIAELGLEDRPEYYKALRVCDLLFLSCL
jgi:hypothetical protein